ncbi:PDR/VanB family oxidoreductase [Pantoea sp. BAV 3049]|uniref:PDR/VanB family oxidoreductase n=1 Tax=Pantoea sp. BAV 3049 TaxID=2654188 RepID=UPI00131EA573|nr:PDR/VanB family oxidoreductase [Pantoea sp. BAV 3049]
MNGGQTLALRVTQRRDKGGVLLLELQAAEGGLLPPFTAGAHITLQLGNGLARQYSLYNSSAEQHRYCIAVLVTRHSRGGGSWLKEHALPGIVLWASPPLNNFPQGKGDDPLSRATTGPLPFEENGITPRLLLAGGIGITPLLAMAEVCSRQFAFHYVGRSDTLSAFGSMEHFGLQAHSAIDESLFTGLTAKTEVYLCGNGAFMQAAREALAARGVGDERIFAESFSLALQEDEQGFWLEIAGEDRRIWVNGQQTMAEALIEAGYEVAISCGIGQCGSCALDIVEGEADHRDAFLTNEQKTAQRRVMPCCSRSLSPVLVIDAPE